MSGVNGFKICTVGWQCAEFMQWTFDSLEAQTATDWEIAVVYDPSTDNGADIIKKWCEKDPERRKYRINTEKKFAPRNQYEAIHEMLQPGDDDVIVFLDLDGDKLSHPEVLNTLRNYYESLGVLLTYGQYRPIPDMGTSTYASEWPREVIDGNRYRKHTLTVGTCFNHLRTMKGQVYKSIPESYFKWKNGEWFEGGTDYIVMISGLELAGGRHKFISEVLLDYNHANPRADNKTHPAESTDCTLEFLRRPPLTPRDLRGTMALDFSRPRREPLPKPKPNIAHYPPPRRSSRAVQQTNIRQPTGTMPMPSGELYLPAEKRRQIIKHYAKDYDRRIFIETGTDQGATTWALKDFFQWLYTIELGDRQWRAALEMFKNHPNVRCLKGDSGVVLPQVLRDYVTEPAILWLDGHHSGPGTARGALDTPVSAELEAVFADGRPHVILVDDARCFLGGAEHPTADLYTEAHYKDYPSLEYMEEQAVKHGYDYKLENDIMRITPRG